MFSLSPPVLQQLHRLDRSSPEFHDQLNSVLCGEEYRQCGPNVHGDSLAWLVDYMDKVLCHVALPYSPPKSFLGSRWSRSFQCSFSEVSVRTQKHMRHQRDTPDIIRTFGLHSWRREPPLYTGGFRRCVRGDSRWYKGFHQTRSGILQGRSRGSHKSTLSTPLHSMFPLIDELHRPSIKRP